MRSEGVTGSKLIECICSYFFNFINIYIFSVKYKYVLDFNLST